MPFFFCKLRPITVLLLIYDFNMSWRAKLVSLKLGVGFSIFDSVSFLLKFIFLFNKMDDLFYFKTCRKPEGKSGKFSYRKALLSTKYI